MNCEEVQVLVGGDPETVSAVLDEHLRSCPECRAFRTVVLVFETRLRRALEYDVTARLPIPLQVGAPSHRPEWLWKRASGGTRPQWPARLGIAAAVLTGVALWVGLRPPQTLAAEVVRHVQNEPASWTQTRPVPALAVDSMLRDSGFVPKSMIASVVYARICDFRGHRVAHFVVMTESGPAAVMLLAQERVGEIERFQSDGYWGALVPLQGDSIAVVSYSELALHKTMGEILRGFEVASSRTAPQCAGNPGKSVARVSSATGR